MRPDFHALPGFYQALFLYVEPALTISPAFVMFSPGAAWFHHQLIPADTLPGVLDARTLMAMWQISNCYMLLAFVSSIVFRAIRDALPDNPVAQERILGACFTALGLADVGHVIVSFVGLPEELRYSFGLWNLTTHGNITIIIFLFCMRLAWFAGVGRERYYYGRAAKNQKSA